MTNPPTDEIERVARAICTAIMDIRRENEVLREALRECQMEARIGSTTIWQSIERITSAALTNTPDKEEDNGMAK